MLEAGATRRHQPQRGDRTEAAGAGDPREQLARQQGTAGWPRRPGHDVRLGRLAFEGDRGGQVDEQLQPEDLDRQEGLTEPGDRRDEDEAEQGDVGREQEDEPLLDVVDDPPSFLDAVDQRRERVVVQDEVGGLLGHGGAAAHRHGDVGGVERRSVIDPVAGDRHEVTRRTGEPDDPLLRRPGSIAPRSRARAGRRPAPRRVMPSTSGPRATRPSGSATCRPIALAVAGWSPVTTTTWIPARLAVAIASATPARAGSPNPIRARSRGAHPST